MTTRVLDQLITTIRRESSGENAYGRVTYTTHEGYRVWARREDLPLENQTIDDVNVSAVVTKARWIVRDDPRFDWKPRDTFKDASCDRWRVEGISRDNQRGSYLALLCQR